MACLAFKRHAGSSHKLGRAVALTDAQKRVGLIPAGQPAWRSSAAQARAIRRGGQSPLPTRKRASGLIPARR